MFACRVAHNVHVNVTKKGGYVKKSTCTSVIRARRLHTCRSALALIDTGVEIALTQLMHLNVSISKRLCIIWYTNSKIITSLGVIQISCAVRLEIPQGEPIYILPHTKSFHHRDKPLINYINSVLIPSSVNTLCLMYSAYLRCVNTPVTRMKRPKVDQ